VPNQFENFVDKIKTDLNERVKNATGEYAMSVEYLITKRLKKNWNEVDNDDVQDLIQDLDIIKEELLEEFAEIGAKGIKIIRVEFVETDSNNWSHAAAYYNVTVSGQSQEVDKIVGEEKTLFNQGESNG